MDLLKYEDDANTADFLDKIYSASLIPQISPTRITPQSKTLIDNVFQQLPMQKPFQLTSTTNISDHLAQFLSFTLKQTLHKKNRKYINESIKILLLASLESPSKY